MLKGTNINKNNNGNKNVLNPKDMINYEKKAIITFSFNREKKPFKQAPIITTDNTAFYIGQMFIDEETIYSDAFILKAISKLFVKLGKDEKLTIKLGGRLGEILNKNKNRSEIRTLENQEEHIKKLFKWRNPWIAMKLNFENLDKEHGELLDLLEKKGVKGLNMGNQEPPLDINTTDSLSIARFLYRVCKKDKSYFYKLRSIKPEKLKDLDNDSIKRKDNDYYAMIEISIRLSDYLNGIIFQGGERRQNRYDEKIREILFDNLNKHNKLRPLQIICNQAEPEFRFCTYHFDSKKYRILKEKTGARNVLLASTAASLLTVLAIGAHIHYSEKNRLEQDIDDLINHLLSQRSLSRSFGTAGKAEIATENMRSQLLVRVKNIVDIYKTRHDMGDLSEEELTYFVLNELLDLESYNVIRNIHELGTQEYIRFIEERFFPRTYFHLLKNGVDISVFGRFKSDAQAIMSTLKMAEKDCIFETKGRFPSYRENDLGLYTTYEGEEYEVTLIKRKSYGSIGETVLSTKSIPYNGYIIAKPITIRDEIKPNIHDGKIVAKDMLTTIHARKLCAKIMNYFDKIYHGDHDYRSNSRNEVYHNGFKTIIMDLLLSQLAIDKLKFEINWSYHDITDFIVNTLIANNREFFKQYNFDLIAYPGLRDRRDALQRTANLQDDWLENDLELKYTHKGYYFTSEGIRYERGVFQYKGEEYIGFYKYPLDGYKDRLVPEIMNNYVKKSIEVAKDALRFFQEGFCPK